MITILVRMCWFEFEDEALCHEHFFCIIYSLVSEPSPLYIYGFAFRTLQRLDETERTISVDACLELKV